MRILNARFAERTGPNREYIGRPSKWGNPYVIGIDGDRVEVIARYETWIQGQPALMASLGELLGKDLICWCSPERCHGEVLKKLVLKKFGRF